MRYFPFRRDSEQLRCPGRSRDRLAHHRHDAGLCASIDNQRAQFSGHWSNPFGKQSLQMSFA